MTDLLRDAIGAIVKPLPIGIDTKMAIADAIDAYALAVHVKACGKWQSGTHIDEARRGTHKCGDRWYCDDAPRRPRK